MDKSASAKLTPEDTAQAEIKAMQELLKLVAASNLDFQTLADKYPQYGNAIKVVTEYDRNAYINFEKRDKVMQAVGVLSVTDHRALKSPMRGDVAASKDGIDAYREKIAIHQLGLQQAQGEYIMWGNPVVVEEGYKKGLQTLEKGLDAIVYEMDKHPSQLSIGRNEWNVLKGKAKAATAGIVAGAAIATGGVVVAESNSGSNLADTVSHIVSQSGDKTAEERLAELREKLKPSNGQTPGR